MTTQEAIQASIEHWERMIEWTKEQTQETSLNLDRMWDELKEYPNGKDCALCCKFDHLDCRGCPLNNIGNNCHLNTSTYKETLRSENNCKSWIKAATKMLEVLKGLKE